jgi:hypothetical protein
MNTRDDYVNELNKLKPVLQSIVLLGEDELMDLDDYELDRIKNTVWRAGEIKNVIAAIDFTQQAFRTEQARHSLIPDVDLRQGLAQKSTLDLLNLAARHLSGRGVVVVIQEPESAASIGETFYEGDALKIAVSPRAVFDGDRYLTVFLHEVAHAKLHMGADCDKPAWKMEEEAKQQAQYWTHYARTHADPTRYAGEGSPAARQFRSKLITLLGSHEAAETIGTY